MTKKEMLLEVKSNLKLKDDTQDLAISDVIQDACTYCNLQGSLPAEMETYNPPEGKTPLWIMRRRTEVDLPGKSRALKRVMGLSLMLRQTGIPALPSTV